MSPSPPSGIVTFLFTDIEGSTVLWDRHPTAMRDALADHDRRIRHAVAAHGGYVFTTAGDSFAVAFEHVRDALDAALDLQSSLREMAGELSGEVDLRVRSGIHTGEATVRDGDYFGATVNRCARIASAGHGGQILVSGSSCELLGDDLPDRVELLDLGVHRLRDLEEPERILQVCHPQLDREFPKIRTLEGPADTLPTQLTKFIGRHHEIGEIVALLAERRLVTLAGPGGAGKTRLALEVAERVVGDHPDGVRLVELAALVDHDVVTDEVAQRFGATKVDEVPLAETIVDTIGDRRMLLVVDNCEHLVGPVARLTSRLLLGCPNLRVIATSRERLAVTGEVLYRVPSLSMPPPGSDVEQSLGYDAIRLFEDRARLADPGFRLDPSNLDDVVSICRRLDGIPLALELAAARVRSMSPQQISSRLDERFRLLTGTDRSSDDRQQTLLSTIEWSHDLLDERERVVFRRLGAFVSNFGLEAAERVCADESIFEFDVVELLTALVDKSMVSTTPGLTGTRYQLLESIKTYALGHLEQAGERTDTSARHAVHFAELAAILQRRQRAGDLASALAVLDEEEDNFRAALRFSIDAGDAMTAARLIDALGYLWYAGGVRREGLEWCEALFALSADLPDELRAGALHAYALMLSGTGDPELGIEVLREQVVIRRRLGDPVRLAAALNNLGNLLYDTGEATAAQMALREAIDAQRAGGEPPTLMLCSLASGELHAGRPGAEDLYREALVEARTADYLYGIALAMAGLGQALVQAGRTDEARPALVEARERFEELNVTPGLADVDLHLALLHRTDGDRLSAARRLLSSITTPGETWYDESPVWAAQYTAAVIDDPSTAAVLVGAVATDYERRRAPQPTFVVADLEDTRRRLAEQLDAEEFARCIRSGARRTRAEVVDIATAALHAYIDGT
ncbi:MAG TPA: adenylate/guanylate cyclase domain-containing protein [Ilumatobacteraceae bacterium]|nr:adenylate/guanylate cyclase domain-containing protein [Ilumatobacteraceae bacterium]